MIEGAIIFCSRYVHDQARKIGLASKVESSGAEFMCDSCMCLSPLITKDNTDAIITNSVKGAYLYEKCQSCGRSTKGYENYRENLQLIVLCMLSSANAL